MTLINKLYFLPVEYQAMCSKVIKVPPEPPTTEGVLQRTPKPTGSGVGRKTGFSPFTDKPTTYFGQKGARTTISTRTVILPVGNRSFAPSV